MKDEIKYTVIVEVNYRAVHTNNYQGGAGSVYFESLLMELPHDFNIGDVRDEAMKRLKAKQPAYYKMENIKLSDIVIKGTL